MKREQLDQMLAKASRSVQLLNKHLARVCPAHADYVEPEKPKSKKRIRQDTKPLLNNLEQEWFQKLKFIYFPHSHRIIPQSLRFKLANGLWYKPDFTAIITGRNMAWEVKGPYSYRGGFENLKMAASTYPEWKWVLVWKEHGNWCEQVILP